jgi:hypothetical protein
MCGPEHGLNLAGPAWTAAVILVNRGLGVRVPPSALFTKCGRQAPDLRISPRAKWRPGNHRPLLLLLEEIRQTTDVPLIGTGGVMSGRDAAAVLGAGAVAVQLGTARRKSA